MDSRESIRNVASSLIAQLKSKEEEIIDAKIVEDKPDSEIGKDVVNSNE